MYKINNICLNFLVLKLSKSASVNIYYFENYLKICYQLYVILMK